MEFKNESEHGKYYAIPELSPYAVISKSRLKNPKFIYRYPWKIIEKFLEKKDNKCILGDLGCANGEFFDFLKNQNAKISQLVGLDITDEFLEVAREYFSNETDVVFKCVDILKDSNSIIGNFDIVTCIGTFPIFHEPKEILDKLIEITKDNGLLVIEGYFNKEDVSIITKYRDDSTKTGEGIWRVGKNMFSEKLLTKIINNNKRVKSFNFYYEYIDVEIPRNPEAPHINDWTEIDKNGNYRITSGLQRNLDPCFLVINT